MRQQWKREKKNISSANALVFSFHSGHSREQSTWNNPNRKLSYHRWSGRYAVYRILSRDPSLHTFAARAAVLRQFAPVIIPVLVLSRHHFLKEAPYFLTLLMHSWLIVEGSKLSVEEVRRLRSRTSFRFHDRLQWLSHNLMRSALFQKPRALLSSLQAPQVPSEVSY